jgi:hypothetical protein
MPCASGRQTSGCYLPHPPPSPGLMRASSVPYCATYRASNSSKARAASGLSLGASPGEGTYLRGRRANEQLA